MHSDSPAAVTELHQRASEWFEEQGMIAEAVEQRLASGDDRYAASLIEQVFISQLLGGESDLVLSWLHQLPGALLETRPTLGLVYATAYIVDGRYMLADPYLERVQAMPMDIGSEAVYHMLAAHNAYWRGQMDDAVTFTQAGLAALSQIEPEAPFYDDVPGITAALWVFLAAAYLIQGRLQEAVETAQGMVSRINPDTLPADAFSMVAALHTVLSEVYYNWNDLDRAEYHARQCIDGGKRSGYTAYEASGMAWLARVRAAQGKPREAQALMDDAVHTVLKLGIADDVHDRVLAEAVVLRLRAGDVASAVAQLAQYRAIHPVNDAKRMQRHFLGVAHGRALLAQKLQDEAAAQLALLAADAQTGGWVYFLIEIRLLQALTAYAGRNEAQALAHLVEALQLGEPGGHLRLFCDEGAPLLALLLRLQAAIRREQVTDAAFSEAYLTRLIDTFTLDDDASEQTDLTAREMDVLRLLAEGLSNADIAMKLIITDGTVKRHLHSIYSKLGVSTRAQAQARAHTLKLLE
jgi:LuxR family maltose regulon positive regulatory protein